MGAVFGLHRVCPRCGGKGVYATPEDHRMRRNELSRIGRLERRSGEPMERPPFNKSTCGLCEGRGYERIPRYRV